MTLISMTKTRSNIILSYMMSKLIYENMVNDVETFSSTIDDLEYMKKSITEEVYPKIFEEAFPDTPPGYTPLGVMTGSTILVAYASERFLKPATAISAASRKFGLSEAPDTSMVMTRTFKRSDYLKYQYLIQKKKEETSPTTGTFNLSIDESIDDTYTIDDNEDTPF